MKKMLKMVDKRDSLLYNTKAVRDSVWYMPL